MVVVPDCWPSSYAFDGFEHEPSLGDLGVGTFALSMASLPCLLHDGLSEYVLVWLTELLLPVFPPGEVSIANVEVLSEGIVRRH